MTTSPKARALERLGQIADRSHSILAEATDGDFTVLASNHDPNWTAETFVASVASGDPATNWLLENLGAVSASTFETSPLSEACLKAGPTTIISDLFAGIRIGLFLSHSKEELGEVEIKEARAAAIVLKLHHECEADYAITAKELIYLEQVSMGATDDEIASELNLSLRAVKERKRKAIDDLRAKNIGHAIGIAKRAQLI